MTKKEIGEVLKQLRSNCNKTQKEVARYLNKSQQLIGHWETGYSQPDINTLFTLYDFYGTTVDVAFGLVDGSRRYIMNKFLTDKLKEGRANKKLRQSDVAKLTGIKSTTLSNYENGVTEPNIDTFLKLCDLYDLDFAELLKDGYGYKMSKSDFDITRSELTFIKRYRELDDHGKGLINILLQKEYERCVDL